MYNNRGTLSEKTRWSGCAKTYTTCLKVIPAYFARLAAEYLSNINIGKSIRFLDVAGGPGTLTVEFIRLMLLKGDTLASSTFICTDYAPGMVAEAAHNLQLEHWQDDAVVTAITTEMNALALDIETDTITDIGCMYGIMFFPDRFLAYAEFLRVLCPGGRCLIGTWQVSGIAIIWSDFMKFIGVPKEVVDLSLFCLTIGSDPEKFKIELEDAGFVDVIIEICEHTFEMPNTRETFESFAFNAVLRKCIVDVSIDELWLKWVTFVNKFDSVADNDHIHVHMVSNIAICFSP